jgi:hypothetical protein
VESEGMLEVLAVLRRSGGQAGCLPTTAKHCLTVVRRLHWWQSNRAYVGVGDSAYQLLPPWDVSWQEIVTWLPDWWRMVIRAL